MDINKAKQEVIDAGKLLVERGLISRTWGNVSCRVDDNHFAITPSGKPYDSLTPDQIVKVSIDALEHEGDVKPSSEKGVHAEVYKARPEINFVIHTHQTNASIMSSLGNDIKYIPQEYAHALGSIVPCAAYGLPSTGTLKKGIAAALKNTAVRAILMSHHGALCFGEDRARTFETAATLEEVAALQIYTQFKKLYDKDASDLGSLARQLAEEETGLKAEDVSESVSHRQGDFFHYTSKALDDLKVNIKSGKAEKGKALPLDASLHLAIYANRAEINNVIRCAAPTVLATSSFCESLRPQVDDFAQIIGVDVKCVDYDKANPDKLANNCVKALKGRNAVMLKSAGALCCASTEDDARAIEEILQKNSLAFLGTKLFNYYQPISALHSRLMRLIYLTKYSKQAKK